MEARVNGITMYWEVEGQGVPLLLVHGFPLSNRMWEPQKQLSGARLITPDLRGHGRSEATEGPARMGLYADDLADLLNFMHLDRVVLGGMSMGGYVALAFVAKYPERLNGLLLIDTKAEADSPQAREDRYKLADLARAEGARAIAERMEPRLWSDASLKNNIPAVAQMREVMHATPVEGIVAALQGMAERPDMVDYLPRIATPTLIITGEEDKIMPPNFAQTMAAGIPGAEKVIIPQAGHMSNMEQPDAFNRAVSAFLQKIEQS